MDLFLGGFNFRPLEQWVVELVILRTMAHHMFGPMSFRTDGFSDQCTLGQIVLYIIGLMDFRCSAKVSSPCSTSGTRHVALTIR